MTRDDLIKRASSGRAHDRMHAIDELGALGDRKAVGPLVQMLMDETEGIRVASCAALGSIADARAVAPLVSLLRDLSEDVRGEAFSALLKIGQSRSGFIPGNAFNDEDPAHPSAALTQIVWPADLEAVKLLSAALDDPDPEIRIGAVYTLGRLGISASREQIAQLAGTDSDDDVRAAAAFALGDLAEAGDRGAVENLLAAWPEVGSNIEMAVVIVRALANSPTAECYSLFCAALKHDSERVRQLGVMGLGRLGDAGALPRLARCLKDPSLNVQRLAIGALGMLGINAAINPLFEAAIDAPAETRMAVGRALARLQSDHVAPTLERALSQGVANKRQAAVFLMGQLGETEPLEAALRDTHGQVRKAAALAMGSTDLIAFAPSLARALSDSDWAVRVAAAEGLKRLGAVEAEPELHSRLDDEHPVVRNAARSALESLSMATKDRLK